MAHARQASRLRGCSWSAATARRPDDGSTPEIGRLRRFAAELRRGMSACASSASGNATRCATITSRPTCSSHAVVRAVRHHAAGGDGLRTPVVGSDVGGIRYTVRRRGHRLPGAAARAGGAGRAAGAAARQPGAGRRDGPRRRASRALALHLGPGGRPTWPMSTEARAPRHSCRRNPRRCAGARRGARDATRSGAPGMSAWRPAPRRRRTRAAVFIDKDGTLIEDVPYNVDPAALRFMPHALRGAAAAGATPATRWSSPPTSAAWRAACFTRAQFAHLRAAHRTAPAATAGIGAGRPGALPARTRMARTAGVRCAASRSPGLLLRGRAAPRHRPGALVDGRRHPRRRRGRAPRRLPTVLLDVGNETVWHAVTPQRALHRLARRAELILAPTPHAIVAPHAVSLPRPQGLTTRSDAVNRCAARGRHGSAGSACDACSRCAWTTLGDVLMTTPALAALRAERAGRAAHAARRRRSAPRCAACVREVDEVMSFDAPWMPSRMPTTVRRPGHDRAALIDRLRDRFDAAVIFTVCTQSALPAALLCRMAGIPLRLAHSRENPYGLLTDWVRDTERVARRHAPRGAAPARTGGQRRLRGRRRQLRLHFALPQRPTSGAHAAARGRRADDAALLRALHPGATRGVAPLAGRRVRLRRPTRSRRRAVACRCSRGDASRAAADATRRAAAMMQQGARRSRWSAATVGLGELAALIGDARLLLSQQQRPGPHRRRVGTPVVVLYALTNPQHTPWRVPARVLNHDVPCRYCLKSVCPQGPPRLPAASAARRRGARGRRAAARTRERCTRAAAVHGNRRLETQGSTA